MNYTAAQYLYKIYSKILISFDLVFFPEIMNTRDLNWYPMSIARQFVCEVSPPTLASSLIDCVSTCLGGTPGASDDCLSVKYNVDTRTCVCVSTFCTEPGFEDDTTQITIFTHLACTIAAGERNRAGL